MAKRSRSSCQLFVSRVVTDGDCRTLGSASLDPHPRQARILLADLIAGGTRVTLAIDEPGGGYGVDAVETTIAAHPEGWRISACAWTWN